MRLVWAAVVALFMLIGCSAASAAQSNPTHPSFDCATAKDVLDQTICGDAKLAQADTVMARLFAAARVSAFGRGPSNELAVQRKWLKERESCRDFQKLTSFKSPIECLSRSYDSRNHDLAIAALFSEPELALQTLRKLDPETEPLYEAVADYADAGAAKRSHIEQLVQPYIARFYSDKELRYGAEILSDSGIKDAVDAVKSGKNLVVLLQVASAYLNSDYVPRPFPCAAIVRRPELLGAEGPMFGSSLDNFIFRSDCADTLPPLPQLDALVKAINDSWPNCEGTIRFSAYRTFGLDVDRARLGIGGVADKGRVPRPRGVAAALITAATNELSRYYTAYHIANRGSPRALAIQNVRVILADGDECD